jgi:hypothetical protein
LNNPSSLKLSPLQNTTQSGEDKNEYMTLRGDRSFYEKQIAEFHKNINSIQTVRSLSKKKLSVEKAPKKTSPRRKRSKRKDSSPGVTEQQLENVMKFLKRHEAVITTTF